MTIPATQLSPQGDVNYSPPAADQPSGVDEDAAKEPSSPGKRIAAGIVAWFSGASAAAWLLSLLMHLAGFAAATVVFALIADTIAEFRDEQWNEPLRASLDDENAEGENPKFEVTPDLPTMTVEREASGLPDSGALSAAEAAFAPPTAAAALAGVQSEDDQQSDEQPGSFMFKLPESGLAVTKGSFTAWTEPQNPMPGQLYMIIIEVRLPREISKYRISDLKGEVIGSDGYKQAVPYDRRVPMASMVTTQAPGRILKASDVVTVVDNRVQLAIKVPGAQKLVEDKIRIRSRRLRENQELVIQFGGRRP